MTWRQGVRWGVGVVFVFQAACSGGGGQHHADASSQPDGRDAGGTVDAASKSDAGRTADAASTPDARDAGRRADASPDLGGDSGLGPQVAPCRTLAPNAQQIQFAAGGALIYAGGPAASVVRTSDWTVRQLFPLSPIPFLGVISSDGTLLATLGGDGVLRVFSVASGTQLGQVTVAVTGGTTTATAPNPPLAFAPNASRIAVLDSGNVLHVFNRATLTQAWSFPAPGPVAWISFSGDSQTVLMTVQDQVLRFGAGTGQAGTPIAAPGATGAAAISGDGQTLALETSTGTSIVAVADGTVLHTLTARSSILALSQDGTMLALTTSAGVAVMNATTDATLQTLQTSAVNEIAFAPDGATLAAAANDDLVVWRLSDASLLYAGGGRDRTVISPVSNILASDNNAEAAFVWDLSSGAFLRRMPITQSTDIISSLSFESNGQLFVDAFSHGELWNLTQGTVEDITYTPASQPPEWSGGSLITPDGKWIVSGGDGSDLGAVRVWDAATGAVVRSFPAHGVVITSLVIDRSGTWLATTGAESQVSSTSPPQGFDIKIWDFASGTLRQTLNGHTDTVFFMTFSNDGKSLLSGGSDGLVRLWSVADGSVIRDFAGPNIPNPTTATYGYGVVISPNGLLVGSGAQDLVSLQFIDLWSTATGQLVRRLAPWGGNYWTLGWSTDGQYLVTGGYAAINVWCVSDLGGAN